MKSIIIFCCVLLLFSCSNLRKFPKETYYEYAYSFDANYRNDTLSIHLKNPLRCPLNIELAHDSLNTKLDKLFGFLTLSELQDTTVSLYYEQLDTSQKLKFIVNRGDLSREIEKNQIAFPFPNGKEYQVIQGYNGQFTHKTITSQYAIDFDLSVGDTITSVDDGFVVGVIEDYKEYGTSKKWLENDKSNYITIYHPHSGLFTQYVHLDYKGALVTLGEFVHKGQTIAISGMTGFTTRPHLHFNVKIPSRDNGLISTEIEFYNGVKGRELKKNDIVKH